MHRVFDYEDFIARFSEFGDETKYPVSTIVSAGDKAMMHITPDAFGMPLGGFYRNYALFLMTAHILELDDKDRSDGDASGTGSSIAGTTYKATIGSVQIENSKQNSFTLDDWNYWLGQTKHGRELLAFLEIQAPCGIFLNTSNDSVRDLV